MERAKTIGETIPLAMAVLSGREPVTVKNIPGLRKKLKAELKAYEKTLKPQRTIKPSRWIYFCSECGKQITASEYCSDHPSARIDMMKNPKAVTR
jgi:hypothetical protein